jgi:hypothetical protein
MAMDRLPSLYISAFRTKGMEVYSTPIYGVLVQDNP